MIPSSRILPVSTDGYKDIAEEIAMQISTSVSCLQYGLRYEKTRFNKAGVIFG